MRRRILVRAGRVFHSRESQHTFHNCAAGVGGSREEFENFDLSAFQNHAVRERTAGIDSYAN